MDLGTETATYPDSLYRVLLKQQQILGFEHGENRQGGTRSERLKPFGRIKLSLIFLEVVFWHVH